MYYLGHRRQGWTTQSKTPASALGTGVGALPGCLAGAGWQNRGGVSRKLKVCRGGSCRASVPRGAPLRSAHAPLQALLRAGRMCRCRPVRAHVVVGGAGRFRRPGPGTNGAFRARGCRALLCVPVHARLLWAVFLFRVFHIFSLQFKRYKKYVYV